MTKEITSQVSPTRLTSRAKFFRPELDVLRFVAFFLVFVCHAFPVWSNSTKVFHEACSRGVQVFFVLSAYLITELLQREKDSRAGVDVKFFYIRRMLRIWPLYFLLLIGGFALSIARHDGLFPVSELISYFLLAGNWYAIFHGNLPYGLRILWSIPVEEQFYLVWPTAIKRLNQKVLLWLAVAVWLTSQVTLIVLCLLNAPDMPRIKLDSIVNLQYFAIGSAISIILNGNIPRMNWKIRTVFFCSGFSVFLLGECLSVVNPAGATLMNNYAAYPCAGVGAALIFFSFFGADVPKRLSPLVFLGKISYGLYVFHDICINSCIRIVQSIQPAIHHLFLIRFGMGLPATIAVAMASYHFLEKPFLRIKERFELVSSRPS